jgi:RNA polymerase sigma-70 factor (ECF subfamily)
LIARCRAGDEPAWEVFVRRFQGRVFGLACTYVTNRDDASDLAQDIFVRLFETRGRWPDDPQFLPWMFQLARNRAVDFLRRRQARRASGAVAIDEAPPIVDPADSPEARAIGESRRSRLRDALRHVSAAARDVLVLRHVRGLSIEETAAVLGLPIGTVKSRANRGRAELAERLLGGQEGRS